MPEPPTNDKPEVKPSALVEELLQRAPIEAEREIEVGGKAIRYRVTCGMLPMRDANHEVEAGIFFIAYTAIDAGPRPLTFSFNGGPGSSSVWLHLGALGPQRAAMHQEGFMPAPPYRLEDNPETWLAFTDLVFLDPVGTGFSRPLKSDNGKKFWGVKGDIESVGEAIRLYLARYKRWDSPLFLVGESYGTTRAAGLSDHLLEKGIAFNGILLVSSILNFQTAHFSKGNDLPFVLFLPTYTATAWYHKRLKGKFATKLRTALKEAERFAEWDYTTSLALGDSLPTATRTRVRKKLASLTGLGEAFLENCDLRVEIQQFCKELLRDQKRTVGRLDSRFQGIDQWSTTSEPDFDPSMSAILPPYTAMMNRFFNELGYQTDLEYIILGGLYNDWDWGSAGEGHPDTSETLRTAFCKNPHLRVFIASGFYDLATPYFATEYTLKHLGLDPTLKERIQTCYYEAGHMMYIHEDCLRNLRGDVERFFKTALPE